MRIVLTPYYKDIFNEEAPELGNLIANIPTKVIISYLSYLNSKLYINSSFENQIDIVNEILYRQSIETKHQIKKNIRRFISSNKPNSEIVLVSSFHILSFIHYLLCNYSELDIVDTNPAQELNIFKAYMVIVDQKSNESFEISQRLGLSEGKGDFFSKYTWPVLLNQIEATPQYNPISDLIRAMCFFNFLEFNSIYSDYVKSFIVNNSLNNTWDYVMSILNIISQRWDNEDKNGKTSFSFICDYKTKPLFESLCVNPVSYGLAYKEKKENHSLMKSTPLFKYEDSFVVLDWNYFSNKLYDGLIFDFFTRSGIGETKEITSVPQFKRFIGKNITEGFTFQKLFTGILNKKHTVLKFPIKDSNGEPDGYYREGNKIILFEIKDAFFAGDVLTSNSFIEIKSEINRKYNNEKKGTGQLLKQIQKLAERSFEDKAYIELKIKPRNFIVYPVLIYTDVHFEMPGISNYLIDEFDKHISSMKLRNFFRRIEKLTFLNLNFFIHYYTHIQQFGFVNIIDLFHSELCKRKKKHDYRREVEFLLKYSEAPEHIIQAIINCDNNDSMNFEELVQMLNLTQGLPE